jgi:hypothetical protein
LDVFLTDSMQALPLLVGQNVCREKYLCSRPPISAMRYQLFRGVPVITPYAVIGAGSACLFRRVCRCPPIESGAPPPLLGYHWRFPVDD